MTPCDKTKHNGFKRTATAGEAGELRSVEKCQQLCAMETATRAEDAQMPCARRKPPHKNTSDRLSPMRSEVTVTQTSPQFGGVIGNMCRRVKKRFHARKEKQCTYMLARA
jgi:hypothetical protein